MLPGTVAPVAVPDDDLLTRLALAADPDSPIPADAVPWSGRAGADPGLLPDWYMPAPGPRSHTARPWQRRVGWVIIASMLAVVASGLCNTYGVLELA